MLLQGPAQRIRPLRFPKYVQKSNLQGGLTDRFLSIFCFFLSLPQHRGEVGLLLR